MMDTRADRRRLIVLLVGVSFSAGHLGAEQPTASGPERTTVGQGSMQTHFPVSAITYIPHSNSFVAVVCCLTVDGSKAVRDETAGAGPTKDQVSSPVDGGDGAKIEVFSGVKVDTGDGRDGKVESSTSLGPAEYCHHHVAKPIDPLATDTSQKDEGAQGRVSSQ